MNSKRRSVTAFAAVRRSARGFGYVNNCLSAGVASLQARWIAH
jgi:hypothetical protein